MFAHARCRPPEHDHSGHGGLQSVFVWACEPRREPNVDCTQTSPEEHHPVRMQELVVPLPVPAMDGVDHLGEGEYRRVAGRQDGEDRPDDGDGYEHLDILREEIHAEVDEDEDFAQLRKNAENVFGGPLRAAGHGGRRSA